MDRIICTCCGEPKPEIAFELNRGGTPRKKCRDCRNKEKEESHRRCGGRSTGPSYGAKCYLHGYIQSTW